MRLTVQGRAAYVYTGARPLTSAQPAVVFVHGAGNDHSVWSLQSRYFAHHGFDMLAPDLPGHGRSEGPALDSVEALADWIAALTDAAGLTQYALVGHSMGALAALEHTARCSERVSRIALLGPAVPMAVSDALLDAAAHDEPKAFELITGWSYSPAKQLGGNRLPGVWLTGQTLRMMERGAPGVLHADLRACHAYANGLQAAATVARPVLLLMGARDLMAPSRSTTALRDALRDARSVILPDTGHAMMSEQPDDVLDALRAFLVGDR
jgi:pimeloyl-ACP methyl ester carboxylesterase